MQCPRCKARCDKAWSVYVCSSCGLHFYQGTRQAGRELEILLKGDRRRSERILSQT